MNWRTPLFTIASTVTVLITATVGAAAATAAPQTIAASDRAVTFVVDGTTTFGTVHLPAHRPGARLAAALLIPGSGPTNRDGDEPPQVMPGTLRLIAGLLGTNGVMTLRFDKYGTGQTGAGAFTNDPSKLDMPAYTRQAIAAYAALLAQTETDQRRILIVGHSEGGLQTMLVARAVHPAPAGLALLAPQDLRLLDLVNLQLDEQLDQLTAAGTITAAQDATNKTALVRAIAQFRAGQQVDTTGMLPSLVAVTNVLFSPTSARFVRSDDAIYPPDVARGLRPGTGMLLTCGTADTEVPCPTTTPLLSALARQHITQPGLRVLPGIDHFLHPAGTPINDQIIAPSAQQALRAFIRPFTDQH